MKAKPLPSQEFLKSKYDYDPDTGILSNKRGKPVGSYSKKEKRLITSINYQKYYVARLIWMLHYGEDPGELIVDHINRNATDNRIENLRAIPQAENVKNNPRCDAPALCTFARGAWQAQVTVQGVIKYLGRYKTKEEATAASLAHLAK